MCTSWEAVSTPTSPSSFPMFPTIHSFESPWRYLPHIHPSTPLHTQRFSILLSNSFYQSLYSSQIFQNCLRVTNTERFVHYFLGMPKQKSRRSPKRFCGDGSGICRKSAQSVRSRQSSIGRLSTNGRFGAGLQVRVVKRAFNSSVINAHSLSVGQIHFSWIRE